MFTPNAPVLPFRTADSRIDAATIVAADIDLVRQSHQLRAGATTPRWRLSSRFLNRYRARRRLLVRLANDAFYAAATGEALAE